MITVILYVNRSGKLPKKCRYFFSYEEKHGKVWIFECQKEKKCPWKAEIYNKIYQKIADKISGLKEWKLLVVDDRKKHVKKDKLFNNSWFLWKLIDMFLVNSRSKENPVILPFEVVIVSLVKGNFTATSEKEEYNAHIKTRKYNHIPRLFLYNFEGNGEKTVEQLEMEFYLILFYLSWSDIGIEYYTPSIIYKIKAEWDWKAFHQYAMQMEQQYEKINSKIEKRIWKDFQPHPLPFYSDAGTDVFPSHKRKKVTITKRSLIVKNNELNNIRKRISEKAKQQFEEIRSHYYKTRFSWDIDKNIEDIKKECNKYECELDEMYRKGIWDFDEIHERIDRLKNGIEKRSNKKTLFNQCIFFFELMSALFLFFWPTKITFKIVLVVFSIVVTIYIISNLLKRNKSIAETNEWEKIILDIERGERRIKKEISCMANYMQACHEYYEKKKAEKGRAKSIEKAMQEQYKLINYQDILNEIVELDRINYMEKDSEEKLILNKQNSEEDLYYPAGWHFNKSLETPHKTKICFPFPFIRSILTDKL